VIDELLVSATPYGLRTALIDNGEVAAFNIESTLAPSLLGNIYLASPQRRSGSDGFVSISKTQNAITQNSSTDAAADSAVFQVTRDGWDGKAPRVNFQITLPGRYVVYFPRGSDNNVARQIKNSNKREKLQLLASGLSQVYGGGVTIRSAAEDTDDEAIRAEVQRLYRYWQGILATADANKAPLLLAKGPSLVERLMRDKLPSNARIFTDDEETLTRLSEFSQKWSPGFDSRLELSNGALFERHDTVGAMARALQPVVPLDGGGQLTIEPTSALTTIDVDCGLRSGAKRHALLAASLEAARGAAQEIRRRNIVGLIVIDFPSLDGADARHALMTEIRKRMKNDTVAHKIVGISESGLMEITRRRGEAPILDALTELCPGTYAGRRPRLDALAFDIASDARLRSKAGAKNITLFASPALASCLQHVNGEAGDTDYAALSKWLAAKFTVREEPDRRREDWAIEVG